VSAELEQSSAETGPHARRLRRTHPLASPPACRRYCGSPELVEGFLMPLPGLAGCA
jgi:hypothetical protein